MTRNGSCYKCENCGGTSGSPMQAFIGSVAGCPTMACIALHLQFAYGKGMAEPQTDPLDSTEQIEVDEEILAGIDEGIKQADEGRLTRAEEVRKFIPEWISKFSTHQER